MGGLRTEAWGGLRVDNCLVRVPIVNIQLYRYTQIKTRFKGMRVILVVMQLKACWVIGGIDKEDYETQWQSTTFKFTQGE